MRFSAISTTCGERDSREMPGTQGRLIDFMIIGAQKGGTNALYRFLRQHPGIGMSSRGPIRPVVE